jgi:hypothetical protein
MMSIIFYAFGFKDFYASFKQGLFLIIDSEKIKDESKENYL